MTDHRTSPADSPYHRTLPIGTRLSAEPLVDDRLSCFEAVTLKELEPMLVPEVLASLGPLMQRISRAVTAIPGVARTHFSRWGDGSEHFHLWALARPAGMMQGRGAMLAFWDDVLPPMSHTMMAEHLRIVAESLAEGGGETFPQDTEIW